MTFAAHETSQEGSRPVELYRFVVGGATYAYTSAEDTIVASSITYAPEAISRSRILNSQEQRQNVVEVTVPGVNAFAALYKQIVPGQRATLTVQRLQRGDTPTPERLTLFQGYVQSVAFLNDGRLAKIAAVPSSAAQSRPIPRFTFQGSCNHVLYDNGCKVVAGDFKHTGLVTAVNGNVITVDGAGAFIDDYFTSGFVDAAGGLDARLVLSHTGDDLTLLLPFPFTIVGSTIDVYAGCDHTLPTCKVKFNNVINFGGFAFVPKRNIFNSGLL